MGWLLASGGGRQHRSDMLAVPAELPKDIHQQVPFRPFRLPWYLAYMVRHHTASKIISQLHDLPGHFHSSIQLFCHVVSATGMKTERGHAKVQVIQQATKVSDPGLGESPRKDLTLGIELDCLHA